MSNPVDPERYVHHSSSAVRFKSDFVGVALQAHSMRSWFVLLFQQLSLKAFLGVVWLKILHFKEMLLKTLPLIDQDGHFAKSY